MRFVIIAETNTVMQGEIGYDDLDLSTCGIPSDVHALQWYDDDTGSIEYKSETAQNDDITSLPSWAIACQTVWQAARDAELTLIAEQEAAEQEAAAQESPT